MALSNRNIITQGLSGLVGNSLVFRQRFGKTIVANAPCKPGKSPSKAMLKARYKFKQAAKYAQHALKDPAIKAGYQSVTRYGNCLCRLSKSS